MSDRLLTDMNLFAQVRELMAVASKFYQKTHYIASEDANGVIDVIEKAQDAKTASIKDAELAEIHHPNYDEPLTIVWLCPDCHSKLHWHGKLNGGESKTDDSK